MRNTTRAKPEAGASAISRRGVLKGGASIAAVAGLGMPAIAQSKPDQLVISSGGGAYDEANRKAYYDSFTEKTGIPIVTSPYIGVAKIRAMFESGSVEIDAVATDATDAAIASANGWIAPIDWSLSDRSAIIEGAASDDYVLGEVAAKVLGWNTSSFGGAKAPSRWEDLMDLENFPGTRGLWKFATQTLEIALLASGVEPEDLYPLDVDRALQALTSIRDNTIFWEHGAQSAQLLIDGETEISTAWNGRLYDPRTDGAPVDYTFDESLLVAGGWCIVKGTKNERWSQELIAHIMDPARQAVFAENIPYGPVVASAYDLLSDERRAALPDPARGSWQNFVYWAENGEALNQAFTDWLVG